MKKVDGVVKASVGGIKESAKLFSEVVDEAVFKFPKDLIKQAKFVGMHKRPTRRR
jgi:hypothetical protein